MARYPWSWRHSASLPETSGAFAGWLESLRRNVSELTESGEQQSTAHGVFQLLTETSDNYGTEAVDDLAKSFLQPPR